MNEILCGDSLELMKDIPNSSILSFVEIGALRVESLPKDLFATCEN
jgi:DNA modification methylase